MSETEVHEMFAEAVAIEKDFINESIPCRMIGMNAELMCQYIEYVADHLLGTLNLQKIYNATNPFDFMELISMEGKTNFFEKRVGEYKKAGVGANRDKQMFSTDEDF